MGVLVVPEGLELLAQRASRLEAQVPCAITESHTSGVFQSHSGFGLSEARESAQAFSVFDMSVEVGDCADVVQ